MGRSFEGAQLRSQACPSTSPPCSFVDRVALGWLLGLSALSIRPSLELPWKLSKMTYVRHHVP